MLECSHFRWECIQYRTICSTSLLSCPLTTAITVANAQMLIEFLISGASLFDCAEMQERRDSYSGPLRRRDGGGGTYLSLLDNMNNIDDEFL